MIVNEFNKAIHEWDGKSNTPLLSYCNSYTNHEFSFIKLEKLILIDERYQDATTWVFKYYLEHNYIASKDEIDLLVKLFSELTSWAAKLHFLQFTVHLNLSNVQAKLLYPYFESETTNQNKFVRAWAYNAIYFLSNKYKIHSEKTMEKLRKAQ